MARNTSRDEIWTIALNKAIRKGEAVKAEYVSEKVGCSHRTARDTLNSMAGNYWLRRDVAPSGDVRYLAPDGVELTS